MKIRPDVVPATPTRRPAGGRVPPWSDVPRFEAEFWTEAPLVDRAKMVEAKHGLVGGKRKITCQDHLVAGASVNADVVPPTPPPYRENNSGIVRARELNRDHLRGIAEVNPEVVPATPPPYRDDSSGI